MMQSKEKEASPWWLAVAVVLTVAAVILTAKYLQDWWAWTAIAVTALPAVALTARRAVGAGRAIALVSLFAVTLVVAAGSIVIGGDPAVAAQSQSGSQSGRAESGAPESGKDDSCPAQFVQVKTRHDEGRVDATFAAKYAKMAAHTPDLSSGQRNLVLETMGQSASTLAAWAYAFGVYHDPNDWKALQTADGSCLSQEGQDLWATANRRLSAKDTMFSEAEAPASGVNTGVDGGQFVVATTRGVFGDRKAIKITFGDGWTVYIMCRCGNPVFPSAPEGVPVGKTDNPKPPKSNPPNNAKDWSTLPSKPSGVTKLGPGKLTSPNESSDQKKSGQTSGNVTDNKVPSGTTSGSTTPDYTSPSKTPVAPGANQGGSDRTDDTTDPGVTNQDSGGTGGDTCIADPDTGVSSCN